MISCPKCASALRATAEGSARALACHGCGGLWAREGVLPLLPDTIDVPAAKRDDAPDRRTGLCPDGHGILIRGRVDDDPPFHLERCPHCRGLWFDAGEWSRIAHSELRARLDDLWDPAARRAALLERTEMRLEEDLRARLGADLHAQLAQVLDALEAHPDRAMALAWIETRLNAR